MSKKKYSKEEIAVYEETLVELAVGREEMDEDEYEELYNTLPPEYQRQADADSLQFADDAIGDTSWRSDW